MKYLKYILGIIAFLILGFFLLGLIKPQITYESEIIVEKPIDESWAVSQDIEKMQYWLDGFQKIEHISGTPGTVGAVADVHFVSDGQEMTIRETITDIVPDESVSMDFESDFMDMEYTLAMTPMGDKTKIKTTTIATGNGMLSKSMIALLSGTFTSQEEANLTNLKKTIEENTKEYSRSEY